MCCLAWCETRWLYCAQCTDINKIAADSDNVAARQLHVPPPYEVPVLPAYLTDSATHELVGCTASSCTI